MIHNYINDILNTYQCQLQKINNGLTTVGKKSRKIYFGRVCEFSNITPVLKFQDTN